MTVSISRIPPEMWTCPRIIFAKERAVRVAYPRPTTLDAIPIPEVLLNVNCRDEIVPILASLQHLYADDAARDEILSFIAQDVNATSDPFQGRPGFGYWEILVLGAVRWAAIAITTNCKTWPRNIAVCDESWGLEPGMTTIPCLGTGVVFGTIYAWFTQRRWPRSMSGWYGWAIDWGRPPPRKCVAIPLW